MKSTENTLESLVRQIDAGEKIEWARKTQFFYQDDGSYLRRIIRRDGTIESEETIPAGKMSTLPAHAEIDFSQA
ncbi:MAG: hypothetical protein LBC14_04695 [Desulfovibrio sp.]|jgi:hypothetical protein|nr:hypothetical protein [Desulfovibrio sp.]